MVEAIVRDIGVELGVEREIFGRVLGAVGEIHVQRDVVDRLVGVLEDDPLPFRIGLHVGVRRAADDQLERFVEGAQRLGHLVGEPAVFVGGLVADLPRPVHLVAEAPVLDAERLGAAVRLAQVAPVAAGRPVDVFDEVARFVEAARAEIDREHHFRAGRVAPLGELVHADRVRLGRVPGEVEPRRALLARPDPVLPVVGGHEIAAGIAHDRDLELADQVDDVAPHAVGVGGRVIRLVDAGVDRAAEVLEKRAVKPVVDRGDAIVAMGGD